MDPSTKLCMGCMNELGSDGRCQVIKDVNQWNDIIIPLFDKAIGKGTQSYVLINEMDLDL